jgi:hypothetical protein
LSGWEAAMPKLGAILLFLFNICAAGARADGIVSTEVEGTQFKVSLASGRLLDSSVLAGAVLNLALPGGTTGRVRIEQVERDPRDPDGDIILHRFLVADSSENWVDLCAPDAAGARWGFPLRGQWNSEGQRISESGFTLICASGAIGKCVRFGYKPWKTTTEGIPLAAYHAACVKAVRADYCGNKGTTRDGQPIDIFDALGIQRPDERQGSAAMPFEAAFSEAGAVCVAHTRVPENVTLDTLAAECPRLVGRLGPLACIESDAIEGRYGTPLIFIRSPTDGRSQEPPQVQ